MTFALRQRLRPRFLVRNRAVLTGSVQRVPERFGITVTDPVTDQPFQLSMFRYPGPKNAPKLLAIHGFRGEHHGLELIVDGLTDFEVFVPDLPGFGQSPSMPAAVHDAQSYAHIVNMIASDLDIPFLVGHSFGSVISAYAVASRPGLYGHLVLLNPIVDAAFDTDDISSKIAVHLTHLFYTSAGRLPPSAARKILGHPLIVWAVGVFMTKTKDPKVLAYTHDQHQAYFSGFDTVRTLMESYQSSVTAHIMSVADRLSCPVTIIGGDQDELASPVALQRLENKILRFQDKVQSHILPDTGHLLHYEKPTNTASLIQKILTN